MELQLYFAYPTQLYWEHRNDLVHFSFILTQTYFTLYLFCFSSSYSIGILKYRYVSLCKREIAEPFQRHRPKSFIPSSAKTYTVLSKPMDMVVIK